MNPLFRRFWIVGIVFASVIDIITTYFILQKDLFINTFEGSRGFAPIVNFFGPEVALFIIAPILVFLFIKTTLWLCDKFWPQNSALAPSIQILGCYLFLSLIFCIKFVAAALNTVSLCRLQEII